MTTALKEPRRLRFRRGLHRLYIPYYDKLCAILGDNWQPISGFRSIPEQARLYAQGRTVPGPIVTKAPPGLSFHNYGLATDWDYFVDGDYKALPANDVLWEDYFDACDTIGLRCLHWEKPHNEAPVQVSIHDLKREFETNGIRGLDALIEKGLA